MRLHISVTEIEVKNILVNSDVSVENIDKVISLIRNQHKLLVRNAENADKLQVKIDKLKDIIKI